MLQTWWTFSTISCIIAKSSRLTHPERIANINHHIYPHNGKRRPATQYVQTQVGAYAATQLPNHLLILHDGSLSSGIQLVLLSKLPSIVTIVEIPKWWGKTHTHTKLEHGMNGNVFSNFSILLLSANIQIQSTQIQWCKQIQSLKYQCTKYKLCRASWFSDLFIQLF